MRLGIVVLPHVLSDEGGPPPMERIAGLAERAETLGFHGVWVTDSLGRGRPTLDPLLLLATLCTVTKRIELGTCVLQVPLRPAAELAHRVHSLDVLSGGRLRLGVGTGSTRADFEVVGADYDARFKTLPASLDAMRRIWRGEAVHGGPITPWPNTEGRPHVMLGAWRNLRWISRAAETCEGWIASGIHSEWSDLEAGMRTYRAAGGARAIVANVSVDLRDQPNPTPLAAMSKISLLCPPAEARARLRRLADIGFDDVLLICPHDDPDQLAAIRDLI